MKSGKKKEKSKLGKNVMKLKETQEKVKNIDIITLKGVQFNPHFECHFIIYVCVPLF